MKIFAAIICYNHSKTIKELYSSIDKTIFDKILIFDDCSTDNSAEIIKNFNCELIQNLKNLGHGGNLKKALNYCFNKGADYVVEIHGDNQYDPNMVKNYLTNLEKEYDLIIGSRFVNKNPYKSDGMPFMRYLTNLIFSKITSKILNINFTEFHTGYKIFSKKFHKIIPYEKCSNGYLFSFQVILQAKYFNLSLNEISITSKYDANSTSCDYFSGLIYLIGNIKFIILFFLAKTGIKIDKIYCTKK